MARIVLPLLAAAAVLHQAVAAPVAQGAVDVVGPDSPVNDGPAQLSSR